MDQESFNPDNPKYKKVEDLPSEKQGDFTNVADGFVLKSTAERSKKRLIYEDKNSRKFSLQEEASELNEVFNQYQKDKEFFINEAPQLIRGNDFYKGVATVAKRFGVTSSGGGILGTTEQLLVKALKVTNGYDKDCQPLLDAAVDYLIRFKGEDYQIWSHTVCHPIEDYGREVSLLDSVQSREVLTKLVDESVTRQKAERSGVGCTDRILGPIVVFNLTEAGIDKLDKPYSYKPSSLLDKEYVKLLNERLADEYGFEIKAFLNSSTPLEFYRQFLERGDQLPYFLKGEKGKIEMLRALGRYFPKELLDEFVKRAYHPNGQTVTYDELMQNFREHQEAREVTAGVYVDVEGTLILNDPAKGHLLNKPLVAELEKLATQGKEVTIFSGGDTGKLESELRSLGFPEHFLPVRAKSDYRGKVLEILFDDTPPMYQGFGAGDERDPTYFGN